MKVPEFKVSFQFGKKKKHPLRLYVIGAVLSFIIDMLHTFMRIPSKDLWALVDELGKEFRIEDINELVLNSPELLQARIEREVDGAIDDHLKETGHKDPEIESVFTETLEGKTPLGGEMRIRGKWVPENKEEQ